MIINFSVTNFLSFQNEQELSLLAVSDTTDNILLPNIIKNTAHNKIEILKSAIILGANASGKTNLLLALRALKIIVCDSAENIRTNILSKLVPFALDENKVMTFKLQFICDNQEFEYILSVTRTEIVEEVLSIPSEYNNKILYKRNHQNISEWDQENFKEINNFINEDCTLNRTRANVPLLAILKLFGEKTSTKIFDFFNENIVYLSGTNEIDEEFALDLIEKNKDFKNWIKKYLPIFQINSIEISKEIQNLGNFKNKLNNLLVDLVDSKNSNENSLDRDKPLLTNILKNLTELPDETEVNAKSVKILKNINSEIKSFPIHLESAGTNKALGLLAYLYNAISNDSILIIDEFDAKFHTLLSKYLLHIFHKESKRAQLITTIQDAQLLDTNILRRDQVWFTQKNNDGATELFSLVEYKEEHIKQNYSHDYLRGIYGAIPYFESEDDLLKLMGN